jgi:hypothetical protein
MIGYDITDDKTIATHWIAYPDETSFVKSWIIPYKKYKLVDHDLILSEDGKLSAYWMNHKGEFIIKKENSIINYFKNWFFNNKVNKLKRRINY